MEEMAIPPSAQAGLWGLLAGSALVLGAAVGCLVAVPRRLIAAVMAFGSGVLVSALAFGLMDQASLAGGLAIAVGALLDGIPESIVIGVSMLKGQGVGLIAVAAVFLSNVPEGLSSAAGMRHAGRSYRYVFAVWGGIALASGLASLIGYLGFSGSGPAAVAFV